MVRRRGQHRETLDAAWRGYGDPRQVVSVLDVSYVDIRPPKVGVVALGELAVSRLG